MAVSKTIATIPPAPSRADPTNFVDRHEAVLDRLETLPTDMNTWRNQVNSTQSQVNASELQAGQSATTATNAASLALTYSNAEQYAAGTTYVPGETTIGSNGTAYRRLNTSAAGDDPVTSSTGNWTPAVTALGAMSTFDLICRIAGMQPTLYLNFKEQDYRHYSSTKGLEKKALADILTFTRGSDGGIFNARSQYEALSTNEPRLDFDPETGVGRGLLVEEPRTNLLTYSEQFDADGWGRPGLIIDLNVSTAPDGTLTANKITENTENNWRAVAQASHVVGTTYTSSIFAKPAERNIVVFGEGSARSVAFNITTKAVVHVKNPDSNITSYEVIPLADGWVRLVVTFTAMGTQLYWYLNDGSLTSDLEYQGDGTSGLYLWGAQLEAGAFPTSYVPTTTAAATRATDVASITGTTFSDFYRQDEGTFLISPRMNRLASSYLFQLMHPTTGQMRLFYLSTGTLRITNGTNEYTTSIGDPVALPGVRLSHCVAFSNNGVHLLLQNGTEIIRAWNMLDADNLIIGTNLDGDLSSFVYFPKRLPNATIQQLSALGA